MSKALTASGKGALFLMSFVPAVALDEFLVDDGLIWLFEPDVLFCAFEGIVQDVTDTKGT